MTIRRGRGWVSVGRFEVGRTSHFNVGYSNLLYLRAWVLSLGWFYLGVRHV